MLLVGRLVYEKGFQLALEAMPELIERLGNVRFLVAGSGTAEADLRRQASELGLDPYGTFLGWIGDDVLHSLYRIADLTVVPSLYEPFGLVALEAMASGCPCIVADTGGLREIVPAGERVGPALPRRRSRAPGHDGRAPAHRRDPARPAGGRGQRARAHVRLGRRGPSDCRLISRLGWSTCALMVCLVAAAPAQATTPFIHAHRGGPLVDGTPTFGENTLPAFRDAAAKGFVLELDVKLTQDNVPVVIHDAELDRVTACTGEVAARTLAELESCPVDILGTERQLRAGLRPAADTRRSSRCWTWPASSAPG